MSAPYSLHETIYFPNRETSSYIDAISPLTCNFIAAIDINLSPFGHIIIHEKMQEILKMKLSSNDIDYFRFSFPNVNMKDFI